MYDSEQCKNSLPLAAAAVRPQRWFAAVAAPAAEERSLVAGSFAVARRPAAGSLAEEGSLVEVAGILAVAEGILAEAVGYMAVVGLPGEAGSYPVAAGCQTCR